MLRLSYECFVKQAPRPNSQSSNRICYLRPNYYRVIHNRARKSRKTLQNKVFPEQLTRLINTFVVFKKCIIQ